MIMLAPTLQRPDPNSPFIVQTDSSDVGLGAVLLQEVEGTEREDDGEDGPEVAAMSWFTNTEDTWYQEWCAKVKEQPNDHPTYKLVAGNLYHYRPNQEVESTHGDDEDA